MSKQRIVIVTDDASYVCAGDEDYKPTMMMYDIPCIHVEYELADNREDWDKLEFPTYIPTDEVTMFFFAVIDIK